MTLKRFFLALALSFLTSTALALDLASLEEDNLHLASVKAAVVDLESGELLYSKHADWAAPIASVTKLMTAVVVMDSGAPLDEWITVEKRHFKPVNNAYSRIRIGSQLKRGDMVRIALMSSENLAAYTLARQSPQGYDAFIAAMNRKAKELGMVNSHFVDSSGLSPKNHSSAADLAKLVAAAYKYEPLRRYTTTSYYRAHFRSPRYSLSYGNTNVLVHRNSWHVQLSKTGYLKEAGRCLVMVSEIKGRPMGLILLDSFGSRSPLGDAGRVKRWLTTGKGGSIAGAALRYEQRKSLQYPHNQVEQQASAN
ncbi:D-alanyl-D-alanine endopeptidase [Marinobacteraceae bacterium S3BR75-40.1]